MSRSWEREGRRPRIIATIEARMGSSRLPGKVLMDVEGKPALSRLVARLRQCETLDKIVLATSVSSGDDQLVDWAEQEGVEYFRGSEDDVLQRVVDAQAAHDSDIVVEITGDCTLLDPGLVDMGVQTFLANPVECVTNCFKPSYPLGADLMVLDFESLAECARTIDDPVVHEHVSLYIVEHPEIYQVVHLTAPPRWQGPHLRLMLDYPEDLKFIRQVYRRLLPIFGERFGLEEIMALLKEEPGLADINQHCEEKAVRP